MSLQLGRAGSKIPLKGHRAMSSGHWAAPLSCLSLQGDLEESLSPGFLMLLSLMLGLALHGFLIRGMAQILCSQSPPPKMCGGE